MARRLAAPLGTLAILALCAGPAAAAERVSVTFAQEGAAPGAGAAVQIYDSRGMNVGCHVPFSSGATCPRNDIAGTHVTISGNTISFVDDVEPSTRCFRVMANDTDGPTNPTSPVSVRATLTHPDGTKQDVGPFRMENGDRIYVGSTPAEPGLIPGGPQPLTSQCTDGTGEGPNRPPVAQPDRWGVRAGWTADENVLLNDYDPDGDPITARVLRISFAKREWSGMEPRGDFLYTAGPGTRRTLNKTITYVAVDSHGAVSAPTTAVVKVTPWKRTQKKPKGAAAAQQPYWIGPYGGWVRLCFGSGLGSYCYTLLSVQRTRQLNQLRPWSNLGGAIDSCIKFGFLPLKNAACGASLFKDGLFHVWDKSVVSNAAKFGDCLLFRVDRNRTLRHPIAGEWGKPQYRTLDSLVSPYNGNARVTGWATWGKWRVPMWCASNGLVSGKVYAWEVAKP
jgi:Bacterial Ig domain